MGKCSFCHKNVKVDMSNNFYTCPHCNTTMETKLVDRPYMYTVGNGSYLEAPHVPVRAEV